jgi:hypothetical protein
LVNTAANCAVRSLRSHGRLFENPIIGLFMPLFTWIVVMPADQSSMFAPGMPTSAAAVGLLLSVSAWLWK